MSFSTKIFLWFLLFLLIHPLEAVPSIIPLNGSCTDRCGSIVLKFPFGSGFGCGHPAFSRFIKCTSGVLQFSTGTGIYTISSLDYSTNTLVLTDPFMSTCSSMQNSGSFTLDHSTPFSIMKENIFVLLGCSTTSAVFDPKQDLCDTGSGSNVCRGLYSCKGVTGIGLEPNGPISTCCVYDPPVPIGSGYGLNLPRLQCSSYSSIYGFGGDEGDPMKWQFGISLQYNNSYFTDDSCKNCEDSGGVCGFSGADESFACICRNGVNTTINCYGRGYAWSGTWRHKIQTEMSVGGVLFFWMMMLFM
ncbi:hypothetical protein HAX54_042400 [Datura stramonium]|uniref:non-specific serine/threonine protein kinase n=2 Tax=Datura stramonium TaxID=4076 RepID=A0ABS8SM49_DATST|nr:hypothetical protein [Datura stramonium]